MKKWMIGLCAGVLALGLTACGTDAKNDGGSQSTEQTGSSSSDMPQDGSSTSPGSDSMSEVSSSGDGGSDKEDGDSVGEGWSEEMESLKTAVVEAVGEDGYWPNMALDAEMLEVFLGLTPDMYEDYMAEMPMISANVDMLVIVRANEDTIDAVEDALNAYRDANVNDTMQYPMNVSKIQASKVERMDSYVVFVQLGGDTMEAMDRGDEAAIAQCQEANELALEAIRQKVEQ